MTLRIQETVNKANHTILKAQQEGTLDKRMLAVGIDINQHYTEYLDRLLDGDLVIDNGVTVDVDGQRIRFGNTDDFSAWLAEVSE
jgi:hypothetical protein